VTTCPSCGREVAADAKFCSECGAALAVPLTREQRKTVTVLFCDVAGSTALGESTDPEALRALLARYFERMKGIVESHGGSVEKFIGDAVMAVFGVPAVHEDDALRACRAAVEMRDALPELGIQGRIGVCTGEVVTGTEERLATGDAVNVAARLEQAAEPGEVLIGAETRALLRGAVEVGDERLLALKGKVEAVPAYPLVAVLGDEAVARRLDVPIVGRERERRALEDAWQRAVSEGACHLFTVLGTAGVGKSRLSAEFLASLDGTRFVRGRCLSYGDGITYWPVVEIVLQLGQRPSDPRAAAAIASLLGESGAPAGAEQIAWAFRTLLEEAAPVVCVFDDLHWAEPTLLDLVDHIADWSRDAPILVLCLARPELLDRRPGWAGGKLNATTVLLEPLSATETDELIERLLGDDVVDEDLRARIREAAEGNPLFVEEMLAMVADSPGGGVVVPPTIQALLAARLDQLDPSERGVLERGAVEGKVFHRGSVEALAPEEHDVLRRLMALVRKELVRPDRPQLAGDDAFRFRHLLIRDAAYEGLPKAARAELHERFADWLAKRADDLVEYDEIAGYHLEQAHRYRVDLGLVDDDTTHLAERAAELLGAAGERALARDDISAALALLQRALELLPVEARPLEWELDLIHALMVGGEFGRALEEADSLVARAVAAGDHRRELRVRLARASVTHLAEGESAEEARPLAEEALQVFRDAEDAAGLAEAWFAIARIEHNACRFRARHEAVQRVVEHARLAGNVRMERLARAWMAAGYVFGPFSVDEALQWFEENEDLAADHPVVLGMHARLEGMRGEFDRARTLMAAAQARALELGQRLFAAGRAMEACDIELEAGNPAGAAEVALAGCAELEELGEHGWLSTLAGQAAQALYALDRGDEAWHWTEVAEEAGAEDDVITRLLILQVRAKVLARRGKSADAERLGREAVAVSDSTDMLTERADALVDLAEVLTLAGRRDEAAEVLGAAEALYSEKGHSVGVARTKSLLAELRAPARVTE
jgi:class 3 adenylate cyclase/tetratricopeptide (TPR) repeat protein